MKYISFIMRGEIIIIGGLIMYFNPVVSSAEFMSGVAILTIGLYLGLEAKFGKNFSECLLNSVFKKEEKKGLFKKKKK